MVTKVYDLLRQLPVTSFKCALVNIVDCSDTHS